jgi:Arc/MetJ family transcription regulator
MVSSSRTWAGRCLNRVAPRLTPGDTLDACQVYRWCMARTNIDLDDELVSEVMRRFHVTTKKAAVDLALRRLVGPPLTPEFMLGLEGIGWEGDLDEMRHDEVARL